jgi:hypothetical protein
VTSVFDIAGHTTQNPIQSDPFSQDDLAVLEWRRLQVFVAARRHQVDDALAVGLQ